MNTKRSSINNILATLKSYDESRVTFYPPAKSIDIIAFETINKLKLPLDYKILLERTNGLSVENNSILGFYNDKNSIDMASMSIEEAYYFEHNESYNPMPFHLIPFCPDGYGNHYCFDLKNDNIVFWEWDCDYSEGIPEVVYSSLGELLLDVFIEWTFEEE